MTNRTFNCVPVTSLKTVKNIKRPIGILDFYYVAEVKLVVMLTELGCRFPAGLNLKIKMSGSVLVPELQFVVQHMFSAAALLLQGFLLQNLCFSVILTACSSISCTNWPSALEKHPGP